VLSNIKILDFSQLLPGPYASMILADMGAEVIKIEPPSGDPIIQFDKLIDGKHITYLTLNRNKKIIRLNLKVESDLLALKEQIKNIDVIIEGFRPGTMDKFGLGYDQVKKIKSDIIYCSITGYGQKGKYSSKAGHDINFQALSGLASIMGNANPILNGIQISDIAGGSLHAVISILGAVIRKINQRIGGYIDISMTHSSYSLAILRIVEEANEGAIPKNQDHVLNGNSIYDYYQTRDGRFISIGALEPKFIYNLMNTLEVENFNYPSDMINSKIKKRISKKIAEKTLDEWKIIATDDNLCLEPVLNIRETREFGPIADREIIIEIKDSSNNEIKIVGHPVIYNNFSPSYATPIVLEAFELSSK